MDPNYHVPYATRGQVYSLLAALVAPENYGRLKEDDAALLLQLLGKPRALDAREEAFSQAMKNFHLAKQRGFVAARVLGAQRTPRKPGPEQRRELGLHAFDMRDEVARKYLQILRADLNVKDDPDLVPND